MKGKKVMAVASAGGHWVQLLRTRPAFATHNEVVWVSTNRGLGATVEGKFIAVRDANLWDKVGLVIQAIQVFWHVLRVRPDVIFTTGAAPGFFAVLFGHFLGARTIWLDSIANAEGMSLAGRKAGRWADHWLTQWPELSYPGGPQYIGAIVGDPKAGA